jgi:phosphatidylethanolamine/phosphatidyl-N-methylethanolamine N-methyltransferase
MDAKRVERVYSVYSGFYDLIFGRIFHKSRANAIDLLDIHPGENILEVGVGTGLSLPLYPPYCHITGIDLSGSMLEKSRRRIQKQEISNVTLKKMDATRMDFSDNFFDAVLAAYVISTVPDPKGVVQEIVRVCKEGGKIVFLNHFQNGNKLISIFEKTLSPICKRIGFRTDLDLAAILQDTPLVINRKEKVHPLHFWKAVQCINRKQPIYTPDTIVSPPNTPLPTVAYPNDRRSLKIPTEYSPGPI